MSLLSVRDLHKRFGDKEILKGIDLEVEKGEIIVILGPSGSGKSTLLRCLNFLEQPDLGLIKLADVNVHVENISKAEELALRRKTAFVFQNYALFRNKTALENITEALVTVKGMSKRDATEKALPILEKVGLLDWKDAWPSSLSGGQQQRVGIGRAMALEAELMLFDEPTSALDPEKVGEVLDLMKQLALEKTTMLVVTHEIPFAREVADRIIFMDEGRIVESGTPAQVLDNPQDPLTQSFLSRVMH
ncbi:amino acid ABC transporter ATP-binding protein [Spongorhabdus nitratireducens]